MVWTTASQLWVTLMEGLWVAGCDLWLGVGGCQVCSQVQAVNSADRFSPGDWRVVDCWSSACRAAVWCRQQQWQLHAGIISRHSRCPCVSFRHSMSSSCHSGFALHLFHAVRIFIVFCLLKKLCIACVDSICCWNTCSCEQCDSHKLITKPRDWLGEHVQMTYFVLSGT